MTTGDDGSCGQSEAGVEPEDAIKKVIVPGADQERTALKERWVLTGIWLLGLFLCAALIETYMHRVDAQGRRWLLPEERLEVMMPILIVYGSFLGGILIAWFTRPFPHRAGEMIEKYRYPLALICTIVFNVALVYLISQSLLFARPGVSVQDDIGAAVAMSKALSFLVAPINLYYFGLKSKG